MLRTMTAPLSGRRAQAARNDQLILESARAVFVADPTAPISAVAEHAGVGISALYRRYASKEVLLRQLNLDGLARYNAVAEHALAGLDAGHDAWEVFTTFTSGIVEEDTHSLTLKLAGTFTPTEELRGPAEHAQRLNEDLFARLRAAGVLRADLDLNDLSFIFEQIAAIRVRDAERTVQLRRRYLALHLDALRPAAASGPLPGPPPQWQEISERWAPQG
jgi:AcrR family transcriptional regulator